jgi:hypothetical protein
MIPSYEKRGWQVVAQSMLIAQSDGKQAFNIPVMTLPVLKHDWPKGVIDLCGLPW